MDKGIKKPIADIAQPLVTWYKQHERLLPWRENPSPYRVWVSEIMLQQTRIEAVLPYFQRFMEALPTIQDLAHADEDVLMKLWEGLGYYSRVRNLQKAARQVVKDFGGELPSSYDQLLTLKGIGEYTAGAIASIAFGKRVAAVDGNVLRVMARLLDDDTDVMETKHRKQLTAFVNQLVPEGSAGDFNQGIMELGETICLPNAMPRCSECPLNEYCAVAGLERARELPTRSAAKPRKLERRMMFVVITDESTPRVLLHKREKGGLLGGMWELPNEIQTDDFQVQNQLSEWGVPFKEIVSLSSAKHVFSHVEWHLQGTLVKAKTFTPKTGFQLVSADELEKYALPTAFRAYSQKIPMLLNGEDV